jgi:hypothetical protein
MTTFWSSRTLAALFFVGTVCVATEASAQVSGWPDGLTCGLSYVSNNGYVVNGYCESVNSRSAYIEYNDCQYDNTESCDEPGDSICAPEFAGIVDGDVGLCSERGFYHQAYGGPGVSPTYSTQLLLPKGTACGLYHTCAQFGVKYYCMGTYDAATSCPPGWLPKVSSDANAPSGCNYVWCEYQDPNVLCTGACTLTNQPSGLVCGLNDNDRHNGHCLGVQTDSSCPSGWQHYGAYDDGRSSGHGTTWCTKP